MPATLLSHQALVLPLKMRWPRLFSGLALCIGSMAPDLEFIGRMTDDWLVSHTISAQFWFTVPVSLGLVWIVSELLVPVLLPYLRDVPALRLHDLAALAAPKGVRGWWTAAYSAWIGGMSHVLLDAVTHGNHSGWLVPWLPMLRTLVPHPGGPVPLHDALQCWLTIVLAIATVCMWCRIARDRALWRWRARTPPPRTQMRRAAGVQLLMVCLLAGTQGALVGRFLHPDAAPRTILAATAFGAIDFVFLLLVLVATIIRESERRRIRQRERSLARTPAYTTCVG